MFEVVLNGGEKFYCESSDSILDGALRAGIYLDYSCKVGKCSSCKLKVIKGSTLVNETEFNLSSKEMDEGFVLSCIRKPSSNLVLDAENLNKYGLSKPVFMAAKISSFELLTSTIIKVTLKTPPTQKLHFIEGQYLDISKGPIKRSYSISNSSTDDHLEFLIKKYDGGEFSKYWFDDIKLNDLLRIEGPKGTFFLRNFTNKKNLFFIATGTGIAPIKSIIENDNFDLKTKDFNNIFIFWGMKKNEDIFWLPNNPRIKFISVISGDNKEKIYVQDRIKDYYDFILDSIIYASGSSDMINSISNYFGDIGFPSNDFFFDNFIQSK